MASDRLRGVFGIFAALGAGIFAMIRFGFMEP